MIPQKFLMMKCIRILFFLHVVGILFFAYKLYSNSASSQSRDGDMSARAVVSWTASDNVSAKTDRKRDDTKDVAFDDKKFAQDQLNKKAKEDGKEKAYIKVGKVESTKANVKKEEEIEEDEDDDFEEEYIDKETDESEEKTPPVKATKIAKPSSSNLAFKKEEIKPSPATTPGLKNAHWTLIYAGQYSPSLYSPPPHDKPTQRLPAVLVIGSPNSGIRPLLDFLEIHPQLITLKKEIPLFDERNRLQFFTNNFLAQMPLSYTNQILIGRTHFSHWTKQNVCDLYLNRRTLKIIVVLRDPVSRILSQATNSKIGKSEELVIAQQGDTLKINNDPQPVEWGRYAEYMKMWTQCFPKSQIMIVEWTDIMQHPAQTVHKIESFLGVPNRIIEGNFYRNEIRKVYCVRPFHLRGKVCLSQKKSKTPILSPQSEALIYQFYNKHNEELFKLLGQRYQWEPKSNYSMI